MAHRIAEAMKASPYRTATALANAMGVSKQQVHGWLKSSSDQIPADFLFKAADALGMSARWLATGEGSPTQPVELDPDEGECVQIYRGLDQEPRDVWMRQGRDWLRITSTKPSTSGPFKDKGPKPR